MKVGDLERGMLLRFAEPRPYKFLHDHGEHEWIDFGKYDPRATLKWVFIGQPLMVYLGEERLEGKSYYGGFKTIRKVSVDDKIAWVSPEQWKYVEPVK